MQCKRYSHFSKHIYVFAIYQERNFNITTWLSFEQLGPDIPSHLELYISPQTCVVSTLNTLCQDTSNEYTQVGHNMFSWRNKKNYQYFSDDKRVFSVAMPGLQFQSYHHHMSS